jgi:hypothetical protein
MARRRGFERELALGSIFADSARHHVRKILVLAEIYPADDVARAISDGLAFQAFSADYITNILETRATRSRNPAPPAHPPPRPALVSKRTSSAPETPSTPASSPAINSRAG